MLTRTADKNPNFRHGKRIGQHERRMMREFNLAVKGETNCRACGSGEFVNAHHTIPRSTAPNLRYDILNCLPLCSVCHTKWHRRTLTIYRDAFNEDELEYLAAARIPGRVTSAWLDDHYPLRETTR